MSTKWLFQTNVVDSNSMVELANIAKCMGLDSTPIIFDGKKILDHQGYEVLLESTNFYIPFGSVLLIKNLTDTLSAIFDISYFDHSNWINIFGKENMLNGSPIVVDGDKIDWQGEELFVRPLSTFKLFKGGVYSQANFRWNVPCLVSKLVEIDEEYRFFILANEVIGKSRYVKHGKLSYSTDVPSFIEDYALEQAKKLPVTSFVIDIAKTKDGLKVIEVNCTNTSGMYACDKFNFLKKINEYFGN